MLSAVMCLMCGVAVEPAEVRGSDVRAAIDVLSEAILAAHQPGSHWDPPRMPAGESTRQHLGGYSALATLALLTAGHDAQAPPLCHAIAWLEQIEPDGTYAVAFRAQVWAALPDRYLPALQRDIDRLTSSFHWEQGGWDYLCKPVNRIPRVSPSTRHVAVLALHAAAERGIEIPRPLLERVEQATIASQHDDGGWSYYEGEAASGSMTSAGVFSLLLVEDLLGRAKDRRAGEARRRAMQRGLDWLDDRFVALPCPGGGRCAKFPQYWLYALERLALASGLRTLAGQDWLREAVATTLNRLCRRDDTGTWAVASGNSTSKLRQRCFGLMLLHRAAAPLACAHLNLGDDDVAPASSLVERLATEFEHQTSWQSVAMTDPVDVWLESPLVLATGGAPPDFLRPHRRAIAAAIRTGGPPPAIPEVVKLTTYLNRGGLLVAISRSGGFAASVRQLAALAAPTGSWSRLDRTHPALSLLRPARPSPRVEAFARGGRPLILLLTGPADEALTNIWAMATERTPFPARLDFTAAAVAPNAAAAAEIDVTFAGNSHVPGAAEALQAWSLRTGSGLRCRAVPLAASHESSGLVVISAQDLEEDWGEIEQLLAAGRVVLLATPPGTEQAAVDHAAAAGISLTGPHAAPWASEFAASWRPYSRQHGLARPGLDLRMGRAGAGELVIAGSDMLHAVLDRPVWGVHGHDAATSRATFLSLAKHAAQPRGGAPDGRQLPATPVAATMHP
ncbi:MAG: hypothetical protein QF733_00755 [Phycisphaerales bacterium]|jgi:hypothetical protein|nr:hypothetical protein [Phycisphaerales bacterium]